MKPQHLLYIIKIETFEDQYLLDYVYTKLSQKRYFFKTPIRPCDFLFNYVLNNAQKKLYIALTLQTKWKECPVCYETLNDCNTVRTICGHYYCKHCLSRLLENDIPTCPCCRHEIYSYYNEWIESVYHLFYMIFNPDYKSHAPRKNDLIKLFIFRNPHRKTYK